MTTMSFRALCASIACASIAAAAPLQTLAAQAYSSVNLNGFLLTQPSVQCTQALVPGSTSATNQVTNTTAVTPAQLSCSTSNAQALPYGGNIVQSASGVATNHGGHVYANAHALSYSGAPNGVYSSVQVRTAARLNTELILNPGSVAPEYVWFEMRVTGNFATSADPTKMGWTYINALAYAANIYQGTDIHFSDSFGQYYESNVNMCSVCGPSITGGIMDRVLRVRASASSGFNVLMGLDIILNSIPAAEGDIPADLSAYGDFSMRMSGVRFYDANDREITSGVDYSFTNGVRIEATTVPEPATLALIGAGLAAIVFTRRRKLSA